MDSRTTPRRDLLRSLAGLSAGALFLRPGAAAAQAGMARQAIEKANKEFLDALARGDGAGCAAVYAENARVLPPNSPMRIGRKSIQEFWQSAIDSGVKGASLTILDVEEHGNTAIEIGAYTLDIRPQGGPAAKDQGKYVVIWKRQRDGSWKLAVDIYNTDLPPAK